MTQINTDAAGSHNSLATLNTPRSSPRESGTGGGVSTIPSVMRCALAPFDFQVCPTRCLSGFLERKNRVDERKEGGRKGD